MNRFYSRSLVIALLITSIVTPGVGQRSPRSLINSGMSTTIDEQVKYSYSDSSGTSLEIMGVADITPDSVNCWNTAGVASPELKELVLKMAQNSADSTFSFRFGRKTRYVIIKQKPENFHASWLIGEGQYANLSSARSQDTNDVKLIRVSVEPTTKSVTLFANITTSEKKTVDLPFKIGAKAIFLDYEYKLGLVQPYEIPKSSETGGRATVSPYFLIDPASKNWSAIFEVKPSALRYGAGPAVSLFGVDKQPLLYVDRAGNPVSATTYLNDPEPDRETMIMTGRREAETKPAKPHKYTKAFFAQGQNIEGAALFYTNVNPKFIDKLQFSYLIAKRIKFAEVPLDPLP